MTKEEARRSIAELIAKYQALTLAKVKTYNEANTKQAFISPLFRALGWDMDDTKEVELEVAASAGRVDFAFKINGVAQFYLEAKPLKAELNNADYVKQAVTYAYNRDVTWAVLCSFAELRVFNAEQNHAWITLKFSDYLSNFDRLWLLSHESFAAGDTAKQATLEGALPPGVPIEQRLFKLLREWRAGVYKELYYYNDWLKPGQRDEVIEKLFNRFIFIRTAEDRQLEEHKLRAAVHQWRSGGNQKRELIAALRKIFSYYTGFYDSDLFDFHLVDDGRLHLDEYLLSGILDGLYDIPGGIASYDFSVIDADVLGHVYEQYLGYISKAEVAKAKEAQARLALGIADEVTFKPEEKKQLRKEQGIYYTPKFVTEYIVKETVGRFIEENEADGYHKILNLKILDPACGSGSFLIRAYDELLNYHAKVRGKAPAELPQEDRMPILTGNIFGVDLDEKAVDFARLNLLLRGLAKRDHLPPLNDNIKRGNSLISGISEELKASFGESWQARHSFDWSEEFKDVMAQGGFDVVIGNPPYVRIQALPRDEADYYRNHFESAYGSFDIYVLFIEQGVRLLKSGGRLGFITSGKFLKSDYGKKIQQLIHSRCTVEDIVDLSAQKIFAEATTYPVMVILRKGAEQKSFDYRFFPSDSTQPLDISSLPPVKANQDAIIKGVWPLSRTDDNLLDKLNEKSKPLGEIADRIFQGLITSADKVYILEKRGETIGGVVRVYSKILEAERELESVLLKPLLSGKDIERYGSPAPSQLLLFPYKVIDGQASLLSPQEFGASYPLCWRYLLANREVLENRENGKMKHERWYAYVYPKNLALHENNKLAVPRLVDRLKAVYDRDAQYYLDNVDVGGLTLKEPDDTKYLYLTGLLNTRLMDYYFQRISVPFRGGFRSANRQYLEPLPIRQIDFSNSAEKALHDKLVSLVETMLELNKKLAPIRDTYSNERDELVKEIEKTDLEIDALVYQLYGLSEEDIKIVENKK